MFPRLSMDGLETSIIGLMSLAEGLRLNPMARNWILLSPSLRTYCNSGVRNHDKIPRPVVSVTDEYLDMTSFSDPLRTAPNEIQLFLSMENSASAL